MLVQSEKTIPPPGTKPDFQALANQARARSVPNQWFTIPSRTLTIGSNNQDNQKTSDCYFSWDNETPSRTVTVPSFEAQARPITNGEYARYLDQTKSIAYPVAWAVQPTTPEQNGNVDQGQTNGLTSPLHEGFLRDAAVRTVYGMVPLAYALDWPVMASYNELSKCAEWMGGRIPTEEEARSIYAYAEELEKKTADVPVDEPTGSQR